MLNVVGSSPITRLKFSKTSNIPKSIYSNRYGKLKFYQFWVSCDPKLVENWYIVKSSYIKCPIYEIPKRSDNAIAHKSLTVNPLEVNKELNLINQLGD
jgi:hypothetical protein